MSPGFFAPGALTRFSPQKPSTSRVGAALDDPEGVAIIAGITVEPVERSGVGSRPSCTPPSQRITAGLLRCREEDGAIVGPPVAQDQAVGLGQSRQPLMRRAASGAW